MILRNKIFIMRYWKLKKNIINNNMMFKYLI